MSIFKCSSWFGGISLGQIIDSYWNTPGSKKTVSIPAFLWCNLYGMEIFCFHRKIIFYQKTVVSGLFLSNVLCSVLNMFERGQKAKKKCVIKICCVGIFFNFRITYWLPYTLLNHGKHLNLTNADIQWFVLYSRFGPFFFNSMFCIS